eukprot:COSAG05_NODE_647_length_8113_cov_15.485900_2_plen_625_part_00
MPVFPETQPTVQFDAAEATFSCVAPGEVLLKLHDDNWLHANVDGVARVHLGGPWSGSSTHRVLLSHGSSGAPVIGADGSTTAIVFHVEPLDSHGSDDAKSNASPHVVCVDGRSEVEQATAAATDTIELFTACCETKPQRQFPYTMTLDTNERLFVEDIVRMAAHEELGEGVAPLQPAIDTSITVRKATLLAYMARDAFGKHPDIAVNREVIALLLTAVEQPNTCQLGTHEFASFLQMYKHYIQVYCGTEASFCDEIVRKLARQVQDNGVLQPEELDEAAGVEEMWLTVLGVEHLPTTADCEFDACVLVYQRHFEAASDEEEDNDVGEQRGGAAWGTWGYSEKKLGSTGNVQGFPAAGSGGEVRFGQAQEDTEATSFLCRAPGEVVLKLIDGSWLADLVGEAWVWLGDWSSRTQQAEGAGGELLRATLLGPSGSVVIGADGHETTLLLRTSARPPALEASVPRRAATGARTMVPVTSVEGAADILTIAKEEKRALLSFRHEQELKQQAEAALRLARQRSMRKETELKAAKAEFEASQRRSRQRIAKENQERDTRAMAPVDIMRAELLAEQNRRGEVERALTRARARTANKRAELAALTEAKSRHGEPPPRPSQPQPLPFNMRSDE